MLMHGGHNRGLCRLDWACERREMVCTEKVQVRCAAHDHEMQPRAWWRRRPVLPVGSLVAIHRREKVGLPRYLMMVWGPK